jgi:predicted DNA-binding protein
MHPITHVGDMDRRTPRVSFRLPSLESRRQLEQVARERGTTVSAYVRSLVLQALRSEQDQQECEQSVAFFG